MFEKYFSKFTTKLNKVKNQIHYIEEKVETKNGVYEGALLHDNANMDSLNIYTGEKLTGTQVLSYVVSKPSTTPWKSNIKIYSEEPVLYITYETEGDTVEAEDINTLQDCAVETVKYVDEEIKREYYLQDGDLVFVRSNGSKELVGRSVLVHPRVLTTFSGFCIRFRLSTDSINHLFLLQFLKMSNTRKNMAGRGANIQNLNQQILSNLDIPVPPISLQNDFAAFVQQIDKSKFAVQKSLEKAETLYKSLMQEYFG